MDSQEQNGNPLGASEKAHIFFQHMLFPLHTMFNKEEIHIFFSKDNLS